MDSIRTNFSELFAAFSSEDSMTILTAFAFTWLIGWLMRYFWDRLKFNSMKESLEKSDRERAHVKTQYEQLEEKYALQEADLKKASLELTDKTSSLDAADAEKRTLNSRLNATLVDLDKSKEEYQEATSKMEDLNDQILGLRTKNAQLNTEMEQKISLAGQYGISSDSTVQVEQQMADLSAENELLKNNIAELKSSTSVEGTAGAAAIRVTELEQENEALREKIAIGSSEEDSEEIAALRSKLIELEAEKDKLEDYNAEIAQLEGGNEAQANTIVLLMEENEQLREQVEALPQYESGNEALNQSVHTLLEENEALQDSASALVQYEAGNEILNATITDLIAKNEALEQALAEKNTNQIEWAVGEDAFLDADEEGGETLDVEAAKSKLRAAIGDQIAQASQEERDDLKLINGIGPFIEEKLNDLGIYTYEQVSQLDEEMVEVLTTAIEFFPGRIDRDDWVGQADRLFYTRGSEPQEMSNTSAKTMTRRYATATEKIDVSAMARQAKPTPMEAATSSAKPDDLKKIEGIGPKIAQLLNEAGIYTFANLSQTSVDRLKAILEAAGNRYKMHNPSTWPKQAGLAAAGEWDKLKELQDYLDGGRDSAKG